MSYENEIAMLRAAQNSMTGVKVGLLKKGHRLSATYVPAIIRLIEEAITDLTNLQTWTD